ncbi:hypothetical protein FQZ97_929360 [compost metagenome]
MVFQRLPVILAKAVHPIGRDHMTKTRAPEGHGVDQGFAQDHLATAHQRRLVPHPAQRRGQVQVSRLVGRDLVVGLQAPAIQLHHAVGLLRVGPALQADHRHDQTAVEVFVAGRAQHAHRLQLLAYLFTGLGMPGRQAIGQGLVGVTQLEALDQLRMAEATGLQVSQRLRRLLEVAVVELRHRLQQRGSFQLRRASG